MSMGWMLRLLQKTGMVVLEERTPKVPINTLVEWSDARIQEILTRESLDEEAALFVRELNDKKLMLSYNLDDMTKKSLSSELVAVSRALVGRIHLPEKITIQEAINLHSALASELDKLSSLQDEDNDDADEDTDKENHHKHQQDNTSITASNKTNSFSSPDPLQQQLWAIQAVHEEFGERLAKSGLQSMGVILQKAAALENLSEMQQRMELELQRKTARQKNIHAKREEKDAELQVLQQHPRYFRLAAITEEQQRLLKNLRDAAYLAERFTIKEKIDELEKSVGDKDLINKVEEARYRADHFIQQDDKLQQELFELKDDLQEMVVRRTREIELFTNLVKMSLGQKIEVTVDNATNTVASA